jgi:hypothetical protein
VTLGGICGYAPVAGHASSCRRVVDATGSGTLGTVVLELAAVLHPPPPALHFHALDRTGPMRTTEHPKSLFSRTGAAAGDP